MSKLCYDFDLCFDLKTTDNLQRYIECVDNPKSVMQIMLREIRSRDTLISDLDILVAKLKEEIVMFDVVSKAHQELVGELMSDAIDRNKLHDKFEETTKQILKGVNEEGSYPPLIFNEEVDRSFCRHCGAGIPHRDGEGRCGKCMHHMPVGTSDINKSSWPDDADQALADVVAMDKEADDPWLA